MRQTTVLLADDHTIVLDGLASLLREHDFDVVGVVGDGKLLMESASKLHPDVIVTDMSMPGLTGLEVLARLKAQGDTVKVILLTMHCDADLAVRAIRAGASGFLLKDAGGSELVYAIQQVVQDRIYLTPALTRDVMLGLASPRDATKPELTPRQLEVLRLILDGRRMKEIGAILDLSTRTVEAHKYDLMETLGVHSTAELVKYALKHRLIPGETQEDP